VANPPPTSLRIGWKPVSYDFDKVPSARYRSSLPVEHLQRAGVDARILPADGSGTYDCVVFQKRYTDDDLALARRFADRGVKVVLDLCDNHFYVPDGAPKLLARADRLRHMIELADVVTVSTPALSDLLPGKRTFVIDDALEVPRFAAAGKRWGAARKRVRTGHSPVRLVWFGHAGAESPPFGLVELASILPELEVLHRSTPLRLTVISNSRERYQRYVAGARFPTRYARWRATTFAPRVASHDVALIPMLPDPHTRCRTNNRARTALLLGLPVIATEIPSYEEFSDWISFDGWAEHVAAYATDPELAGRHVRGAQQHIRSTYTPQHVVEQWSRAFEALLDSRAASA
jgi:hypothetical protein